MTTETFAAAATATNADLTPRRPQDHGPLTPAEIAVRKQETAVTKSQADAYHGLCQLRDRRFRPF